MCITRGGDGGPFLLLRGHTRDFTSEKSFGEKAKVTRYGPSTGAIMISGDWAGRHYFCD